MSMWNLTSEMKIGKKLESRQKSQGTQGELFDICLVKGTK